MDQVCRICLKTNVDNSFAKLTNQCDVGLSIYDCFKILTCIDLEDQNERDLSRMCQECLKRLISCINFRSLAIKNSDYLNNLKIGFISFDPLNGNPADVKDLVLNDFTGYQAADDLDTFCLSSVKVEYVADDNLFTAEMKEEQDFYEFKENRKYSTQNLKAKSQARRIAEKVKAEIISCTEFDCNEVFRSKTRLLKHKNAVHPPNSGDSAQYSPEKKLKKTLCTFCGKYLRSEHFKDHILRMHFDGKISKFLCDYCGRGFLHKCGLRDHMFRHINHRTFKCDECDFWTVSQSNVNAHKKIKHAEIVYQTCSYPECNYTCKLMPQLKQHIATGHLGIRPFICVECGKSFVSSSSLTEHKATHSDEKNFECDICQKRFKTKVQRNTHSKQAHQEAKFHCEICSKPFHSQKMLEIHINQIHDKIRSFECNFCDKKYTTRKYLLDHVKEIHFKTKITCEICGTKLARMVNYKMHVKAKHKDLGVEAMTALKLRMKKLKPDYEKMEYYYIN